MKVRRSNEYQKILEYLQVDDEGYILGIWLDEALKMHDVYKHLQDEEHKEWRKQVVKEHEYLALQKQVESLEKSLDKCHTKKGMELVKALKQVEELQSGLGKIMRSMLVHPDCTEGSEFDDMTSMAQELIDKH